MRPLAFAGSLAGIFASGFGVLLASRLAYADLIARRDTAQALERAAALDVAAAPAAYFERLAELDPAQSTRWLYAALTANPRSSQDWIALGLAAERAHDLAAAERELLQAASVDHQYLPAWTLANFYFRQPSRDTRRDKFWTWARRAAGLTYDDYRPLLGLAHEIEPGVPAVLARLGSSTPLLRADLDFLVQRGALDQAQPAARLLLARETSGDVPRLLAFTDRLLLSGRAGDALEIWNALRPGLDPDRNAVANGDLSRTSSGLAFDWRLTQGGGFSSSYAGTLSFNLTGQQPESCSLLEQFVPLDPARRYRLRFEYSTSGLPPATGLLWDLDGASAPIAAASSWRSGDALLISRASAPGRPHSGKLRLLYQREPGTVRAQGQIQIRRYSLEAL